MLVTVKLLPFSHGDSELTRRFGIYPFFVFFDRSNFDASHKECDAETFRAACLFGYWLRNTHLQKPIQRQITPITKVIQALETKAIRALMSQIHPRQPQTKVEVPSLKTRMARAVSVQKSRQRQIQMMYLLGRLHKSPLRTSRSIHLQLRLAFRRRIRQDHSFCQHATHLMFGIIR